MRWLWNIGFALMGCGIVSVLMRKKPVSLTGTQLRWAQAAALFVNCWIAAAGGKNGYSAMLCLSRVLIINGLLLMTITDLKERMVYDIHFYVLLLAGAATAFFQPEAGFIGMYLFFLLLFGVLFLAARKNDGLGMGDSRMIACLALYFPFSRWMEVMLLSLGTALVYGLIGIVRKKKTLKTAMPFFPFLLIGVLIECIL